MDFSANQCYFCSDGDNLIQMNTNSLIINSLYIDFAQLILEVLQIKVRNKNLIFELKSNFYYFKIDDESNNMICIGCKDQLSQFYMMKQQASKHLKPADIRKMEILDIVAAFVDSTSPDCVVSKYSKLLAVHVDSTVPQIDEQLSQCNFLLESEVTHEEVDDDPMGFISVKEEGETVLYELAQIEVADEEEVDIKFCAESYAPETVDNIPAEIVDEIKDEKASRKRPKKYQKSTLEPKQREWVRKKLKECAVVLQTSFGCKTQWRCNKCAFKCFSSENAFRLHLKAHLEGSEAPPGEILEQSSESKTQLNSDEQSYIEQRLWIQQQLQSQRETVQTSDGGKSLWACSQCNFVANKRGRFRLHLQKVHTTILMRGPNKHSCYDCHLRFDGENHLMVHRNCHRIFDVIASYASYPECDNCKMFFCTSDDLQLHINRHKENPEALRDFIPAIGVVHRNGDDFIIEDDDTPEILDEDAITCGHCLVKFGSANECKHHLMLYHATFFTCPFDSRVFSGIPTLSFGNHLRQCHSDIFPDLEIACSFCKMLFDTVYDKLAHMKKCKSKSFVCDHCDKSFFRKAELLHHLKVVTGLMVFAW